MKLAVIEVFGSTIYDQRAAHARWPRLDGGRWMVRTGEMDRYTISFARALWTAFRARHELRWRKFKKMVGINYHMGDY